MKLSKFDAAERQLIQAIKLFLEEGDQISVHTLIEAANQVLRDIGGDHGATSFIRNHPQIPSEKKREFYKALSKSKNFFKHADKDKDEFLDFDPATNHLSLLEGAALHTQIKKGVIPEVLVFELWFFSEYPDFFEFDKDFNDKVKSLNLEHENLSLIDFKELLSYLRDSDNISHGLCFDYGL